jgi:hemolysin III
VRYVIEMLVVKEHHESVGEEIANSISHGVGFLAAVAAVPILVVAAVRRGDAAGIVGGAIFATTMVVLYLASTLYHAWPRTRMKRVLQVLDHGAIFLLIAGTYTPFTLGVLRGGWGWTLFGIVWGLALAGVMLKVVFGVRYPRLSTWIYICMGWLGLIAVKPLWIQLPQWGFFWLLAGGIAYTAGVFFYAVRGVRYSHFVWHLFVLAGSCCHFFAVLHYAP